MEQKYIVDLEQDFIDASQKEGTHIILINDRQAQSEYDDLLLEISYTERRKSILYHQKD